MTLLDRIQRLYTWTLTKDWLTWVAHAGLGLTLALAIGVVAWTAQLPPATGAWCAVTLYGGREVEQAFLDHVAGRPINWLDHWADLLAPLVAVMLWAIFVGWTW